MNIQLFFLLIFISFIRTAGNNLVETAKKDLTDFKGLIDTIKFIQKV